MQLSIDYMSKWVCGETVCPVAAIIDGPYVLMGKKTNYRYRPDAEPRAYWTLPGGRAQSGETVLECLRRQVREDLGIHLAWIHQCLGIVEGRIETDLVPVFVCGSAGVPRDAKGIKIKNTKYSEWGWVSIQGYGAEPRPLLNPLVHGLLVQYERHWDHS